LNELTPLLPRCVANNVLIKFVEALILRYQKFRDRIAIITEPELKDVQKKYEEEVQTLRSQCENLYFELIDKLGIAEFDEKAYFKEVNKFLEIGLNEIQQAVIESRGDINNVILKLSEFKNKTYNVDIRFVAQTIATGAQGISMDSDVIWLFTFYALRRKV